MNKMELNEEIELKSKNFHDLELDDRLLKVKSIRQILIQLMRNLNILHNLFNLYVE